MARKYHYNLGFAVKGTPLPDPTAFSGETSDLDISAERDTTGLLHREWVAQKIPTSLEWKNIGWDMCQQILQLVNSPSFQFTFPDPNTGLLRTGTYYAGNRKWTAVWLPTGGEWIATLSFSLVEY